MLPSQALWGGIAIMNQAQFERDKEYGAATAIANHLYHRELISLHEYQTLTAVFMRKYCPMVSSGQSHSPGKTNELNRKEV